MVTIGALLFVTLALSAVTLMVVSLLALIWPTTQHGMKVVEVAFVVTLISAISLMIILAVKPVWCDV